MADCVRCGRTLTSDEIGLSKKLTGRATTKYYCITCLAADFGVTEQRLREKIEEFRAEGCTLFRSNTFGAP